MIAATVWHRISIDGGEAIRPPKPTNAQEGGSLLPIGVCTHIPAKFAVQGSLLDWVERPLGGSGRFCSTVHRLDSGTEPRNWHARGLPGLSHDTRASLKLGGKPPADRALDPCSAHIQGLAVAQHL